MTTTSTYQSFYDDVRASARGGAHGAGALASALNAVQRQRPDRERAMAASAEQRLETSELTCAVAISMIADVVSAATSEAIRVINREEGAKRQALLHQLVDLWAQAEAIRALWLERYVKWPHDRAVEKVEALAASTRLLCAGMAAVSMAEGWDWSQLADLLEEIAGQVSEVGDSKA